VTTLGSLGDQQTGIPIASRAQHLPRLDQVQTRRTTEITANRVVAAETFTIEIQP
jgi:hypothetical protein